MEAMAVPPSMAPDVVGAFRMTCKASHLAYDDPIVYPGQPGASHLHQFFGNTLADANSTYQSLRTSGDSTCHSKLNRSAYWIPAMMNGRGQVVVPDFLTVYYKRFPKGSAECQQYGICIQMPRGLRYVFGRSVTDPNQPADVHFDCQGPGAVPGAYATLAEAAAHCPSGAQIGAVNGAPSCWNGSHLDSVDHRSHLSYPVKDATGVPRCPLTHPYVIPTFILSVWYTTDDTIDRSGNTDPNLKTWYFTSDRMAGMTNKVSGATYHSDWFGAWDDTALKTWTDNCIDKMLSCTTGNMGNGTGLKWLNGFNFEADQRLVNPPNHVSVAMLRSGNRKLKPDEQEMVSSIRRKLDTALKRDNMLASASGGMRRPHVKVA
jgi:hypothetical protein